VRVCSAFQGVFRIAATPQSESAAVLRCVNVHKSYSLGDRKVVALRGVSLEIAEPGFYAIMGASGSGKSTLLHLLAALDRPDEGEIYIAGKPIHTLSERDATMFRRTQIGIIFQQFNLIPTLTARENVELPGMLAGTDAAWLRTRSEELLGMLGLTGRGDHRPDALSGGEQQRVAIARALLYSPPVVFADEPTGNLDSASSAKLWGLLADLAAKQRTTVVMVTHEPAAAANCRRVIVLKDGVVRGTIEVRPGERAEVRSGATSATHSENGQRENGVLDAGGVAARYQECVR